MIPVVNECGIDCALYGNHEFGECCGFKKMYTLIALKMLSELSKNEFYVVFIVI